MSLKEIAIIIIILVILTVGIGALVMPAKNETRPPQLKPFSFAISPQEYGSIDSNAGVRDYLTLYVNTSGTVNFSLRMITVGKQPRKEVYEVDDYPPSEAKQAVMMDVRKALAPYGIQVVAVPLYEALGKKDAVIILPSDAIPDQLAGPEFQKLLDGNAVIFFGKPLDIAVDQSGSQKQVGASAYAVLNLSGDGANPSSDTLRMRIANGTTLLEYANGWLVLYNDREDGALGSQIASLILNEGWQSERDVAELSPELLGNRSTVTIFSGALPPQTYYGRLLYAAKGTNSSLAGILDLGDAEKPYGTLHIAEKTNRNASAAYSFELHDNFTSPISYDFSLQFIKDGKAVDSMIAKSVTLKTFATESGSVTPHITPGDYIVKLVDQEGLTHAAAYTHVPDLHVNLVRIEGDEHIFIILLDGTPASSVKSFLTIDGNETFPITTDENGEAKELLMLSTGLHSFMVELAGETAITYFRKTEDTSNFMLYGVLLLGGAFLIAGLVLNTRGKRKFAIHTYHRPATPSRILRIPYSTFIELFGMTQKHRARGMPLSVSDLRIGMRMHAAYRGMPLFLTDSNIYNILDSLVRKGRLLSYGGYFLPVEMAGDKPIEYWVMKRKLSDHLLERGDELKEAKKGGFAVRGKTFHLWPDIYPNLVHRTRESVIIFPDEDLKKEFFRLAHRYDPLWMELSLELQYGSIRFLTIDEFIEHGLHGQE